MQPKRFLSMCENEQAGEGSNGASNHTFIPPGEFPGERPALLARHVCGAVGALGVGFDLLSTEVASGALPMSYLL